MEKGSLVWLEVLLKNKEALKSFREHLHELLDKKRAELEDCKDMEALFKARGAVGVIKEQLLFLGNQEAEKDFNDKLAKRN